MSIIRKLIVGVAASCVGVVVMAGPAAAATGTQTIRVIFTSNPYTGAPGTLIATGVIKGVGTGTNIASHTNPDGTHTDTELLALPGGTITLTDTATSSTFSLDPVSCIARFTASGPYTIASGTKAYQGVSGNGTFKVEGTVGFNRTGTGSMPLSLESIRELLPQVRISGEPSILAALGGGCSKQSRVYFSSVTGSGPISVP